MMVAKDDLEWYLDLQLHLLGNLQQLLLSGHPLIDFSKDCKAKACVADMCCIAVIVSQHRAGAAAIL